MTDIRPSAAVLMDVLEQQIADRERRATLQAEADRVGAIARVQGQVLGPNSPGTGLLLDFRV